MCHNVCLKFRSFHFEKLIKFMRFNFQIFEKMLYIPLLFIIQHFILKSLIELIHSETYTLSIWCILPYNTFNDSRSADDC